MNRPLRIDVHVHVIGTGRNGSGCTLKVRGTHYLLARYILRDLGLPGSLLQEDLETVYVEQLRQWVRQSSLDKIVILANDHTYREDGMRVEKFGSMYVPNDFVLQLCRDNPEFLPGVSIHPARPDAMDELDRCLEQGAALMKCLPNCHNIDCRNPRYAKFWMKMAEAGLPLLAHTGGELSLPVYDKKLADPRILESPLACGVKVIAAHCGTNSLLFDPDYVDVFAMMLQRYPNLYGDNSGMQTPFRSRHFPRLLRADMSERLVHGSDLPIPISGRWVRLRGLIDHAAMQQSAQERNPLERDIVLKRAMGFSEATFERAASILRLPNQ